MKFFKKTKPGTCNIIAIQHVLSFFNSHPTFVDIQSHLPKHTFGNWLTEIGVYFEKAGYTTRLVSNQVPYTNKNNPFVKTLDQYKRNGVFEERIPMAEDITDAPVIINVDAFKIRGEKGGPGAHYVVVVREGKNLYMYDGNNFDKKKKVSFDWLYKTSIDINEYHENGMWLFVEKQT